METQNTHKLSVRLIHYISHVYLLLVNVQFEKMMLVAYDLFSGNLLTILQHKQGNHEGRDEGKHKWSHMLTGFREENSYLSHFRGNGKQIEHT